MPIYRFEFKAVRFGATARPYVPVVLTNPHSGLSTSVYGLVDTGADDCALPAAFASLLGHHLEKGITKEVGTGNGTTTAYSHTSRISFDGFSTEDILIDYLPNLKVPLLGVRSFLSRFIVTIDYPSRKFSLEN
jgi:predicted aspartyl protease